MGYSGPMCRRGTSAMVGLALLVTLSPAALQAQSPDESSASRRADQPEAVSLEPRALPNYDGREEPAASVSEALLWVPRVLLSPLYFVSEFVLRRPLELAVTSVEEREIAGKVLRFFTFGPDNRFFLSPSATFDLGFRPNIGFYFGVQDAFTSNNELRVNYSFGGVGLHIASITDRYSWDDGRWELALRTSFAQRPDGRYFGTGTGVRESLDSQYSFFASDTQLYVQRRLGDVGQLRVHTDLRFRSFSEDVSDGPTVPERVLQEMESLPPGYTEGYTIHLTGAALVVDSRPERPNDSTGIQAAAEISFAYSLRDPSESMWLNYGLSVAGYWDISGVNHIVSLAVGMRLADGIRGQVPFTEQPVISGGGPMNGFIGAFLTGPSAVSATLSYSWPMWIYLDGIVHVAVGNVFDERFSGFSLSKFRLSTGIGIAAVSKRDHFFEFLVGFGTDTFEAGATVDSVRLIIGARREF